MTSAYAAFLERKTHLDNETGFSPIINHPFLYDFQCHLVDWSLRIGRSAIFADCGLGKTPMQLSWSDNVVRHTNGNVLILTPLAVSAQTKEEGEKFGIEVHHCKDGKPKRGINVTNYQKLHHFNPDDFSGVVCDESSAIKDLSGKLRAQVTAFMRKIPYRLLCTATPSPNDYTELGASAEALGHMGQRDMLTQFFRSTDNLSHLFYKNGDFWNKHKWMFKAHSEKPFWRWVCSWAMAVRTPEDIGFDGTRFILPELRIHDHVIDHSFTPEGELFPRIAVTLAEQRLERRHTMKERCEEVARIVDNTEPALVWCHLNTEGDYLEHTIPGAVQVSGSMPDEQKEERLLAFSHGEIRCLVTKPTIAGFGMNWQHCGRMTFFPSHSFEQYYQGLRRCLRFGRKGPVDVHIVTTPGEAGVTGNLKKKQEACDRMFQNLIAEMNNFQKIKRNSNTLPEKAVIPSWL